MKICPKCSAAKPVAEFSKHANTRDGLQPHCKTCAKIAKAAYKASNQEKIKAWNAAYRAANKGKIKVSDAAWKKANPDKLKSYQATYYATHIKKIKAKDAAFYAANCDKIKAKRAADYAANADKMRAKSRAWYASNPAKGRSIQATYRAANPDKVKADNAAWAKANPEYNRLKCQNRRARKLASGGKLSKGLTNKLFKLQRGKCACCKIDLRTVKIHLDHIMPLALGGTNNDNNIQLLCQSCNSQKHAKHPVDFMQSRGFLI